MNQTWLEISVVTSQTNRSITALLPFLSSFLSSFLSLYRDRRTDIVSFIVHFRDSVSFRMRVSFIALVASQMMIVF